jgi:hypothetical protein
MTLIALLVGLVVGVLIVWAVRTVLPLLGLPAPVQTVLYVVLVVIVVLWFLSLLSGGFVLPRFR